MSSTKRKIFASDTSDEDDSFKHRRSSLRVNLSYNDNLTDSGNGSLWRIETGNDERETNGVQSVRRLSRSKSTYEKNRRSDNKDTRVESDTKNAISDNNEISVRVKEGVRLKHLTVNLEDISKEHYLETNCKRLKDAILHKTKQIFDRENELSVKTALVLGNRDNSFASSTHPNIGNKTVMLDITNRQMEEKAAGEHEQYTDTLSHRQREDRYSNIVTTPTKNDGQKSLEKIMDKSRLNQRRLFVEKDKQMKGQTKCRIIEDVILKKNLPLFSLRQSDESGSPILSGSNRRRSLFKELKLRSQNQFENFNNTYSTVHSIPNVDIGMPVVCSTFIENNATADKGINNDMDTSCATYTTNKVISMEMTEVHGGIRTSKEHLSLRNRNLDANNCNRKKKEKSKEDSEEAERNRNASSLEDIEHPMNKITVQNNTTHFNLPYTDDVNDQDVASFHIDTVIPMQISIEDAAAVTKTREVLQAYECDSKTKCQNERRCTISLSDSNDSIRSSLNVNTSLDGMTETGKSRNVRKFNINNRRNYTNQETIIGNKKSIVLNDQNESANTIRTSLQMNTSVDSMRKTCQRRDDKDDKDRNYSNTDMESSEYRYGYLSPRENKKTNNIDSLENISLIERLRNISMRNQVSHNDKSRISKIKDEYKRRSSNSGDSCSYVEGTPYPISRSVLFKSQLKYKTHHLDDGATCSSNLNSTDNEENDGTKSITL